MFPFSFLRSGEVLPPPLDPGQFYYVLPSEQTTSAGVYDTVTGNLIRTLWSNELRSAGEHIEEWDGEDDNGNTMSPGVYQINVNANSFVKTWCGVFGNTSTDKYGPNKYAHLRGFQSMAIASGNGYAPLGFCEGTPGTIKINLSAPQGRTNVVPPTNGDFLWEGLFCVSDGTKVYWCGFDPWGTINSAVYATNVSDDELFTFSSGVTRHPELALQDFSCVNGVLEDDLATNIPSGMAVQTAGNHLFVSQGGLDIIKVYHKTTGAFIRDLAFTAPGNCFVDSNDFLWVCHSGTEVSKYSINGDGTLDASALDITTIQPLAVSVTPDGDTVVIVDGGSSQQIKAYDAATGAADWTLGTAGGYIGRSLVDNETFMFNHPYWTTDITMRPFIVFEPDGSFWVNDGGNMWVLKFDDTQTHETTIMSMRMNYNCSWCRNDPSRLFSEHLEFEVDLASITDTVQGNWVLKYNWGGNFTPDYIQFSNIDNRSMFKNCITMSNGRTYAMVDFLEEGTKYPEWVELESTGVRFLGASFRRPAFQNVGITDNGDMYWYEGEQQAPDGAVDIKFQERTGYDGNDPQWDSETVVATGTTQLDEPLYLGYGTPGRTSSDKYSIFAPSKDNEGRSIGLIQEGESTYFGQSSMSTSPSYTGDYPTDGMKDIGNSVEYAGGDQSVSGRYINWNYIGEFWKGAGGQVNKHQLFYDNMLMLALFGKTVQEADALDGPFSPREMAGNAFAMFMFQAEGFLWVIHNDESFHGGCHLWKISNLNSLTIHDTTVTIE